MFILLILRKTDNIIHPAVLGQLLLTTSGGARCIPGYASEYP
jgi:hypothetical protein